MRRLSLEEIVEWVEEIPIDKAETGELKLLGRIERLRILLDNHVDALPTKNLVTQCKRLVDSLWDADLAGRYGDDWLDVQRADSFIAQRLEELKSMY